MVVTGGEGSRGVRSPGCLPMRRRADKRGPGGLDKGMTTNQTCGKCSERPMYPSLQLQQTDDKMDVSYVTGVFSGMEMYTSTTTTTATRSRKARRGRRLHRGRLRSDTDVLNTKRSFTDTDVKKTYWQQLPEWPFRMP